ncbi:hypothetical protein [Ornithinimicrobium murale]|uniref:hypothetical protein n=1 Tax=Ornithinimicrobium murale TaxID=1050153 RepID=UPI000E0DA210|nr:hypothetical protein [Ornithinimicrobium murale]
MTALATRPEDLRVASRALLGAAAELSEAGHRVQRAEAEAASGWQGVAALGQRLATQRVATAVLSRCGPAEQLAGALGVFADQAEQAKVVVRAAQGAGDEARAQRVREIAQLAAATDPQVIDVLRQRILRLEQTIRRSEDEIDWAEEQLERGRRTIDRLLRDSWVGLGVEELKDLVRIGQEVAPIWRGGGLLIVGSRVVLTTARLARDLTPVARHALEVRLARLLTVVRKPPVMFLLTRLPFRVLIPLTVIPSAVDDLRTGGGYEGVQGFSLRLSAAVAIPGSVAMVLPHPVVAGLGSVSVGIYYLAKGGYAIWDHRILLTQVGAAIIQKRHAIIEAARRVLRPSPAFPLGPLGPMQPLVPGAKDLLSELPRLSELGRFLPGVGGPVTVPNVPIDKGLRLPVIPSPSMGAAGLGILLPSLGKLF